jgi:multidrug efflux system outer membrane protein
MVRGRVRPQKTGLVEVILTLFFSGCSVGPNYVTPDTAIKDAWQTRVDEIDTDPTVTAWWSLFKDPMLNRCVEMAALQNQQIAQAEAAILQARALRDVAASKFFPQISSDLSAVKTYFSKNGPVYAVSPGGGPGSGTSSQTTGLPFSLQVPQVQNLFTALLDASWEIDFFGKTRRTVESAQAHVESTIEQRNGILLSVIAETARNYIELRGFQKQAEYLTENIHLLEKTVQIIYSQRQSGIANAIDLETIEATLAQARADLPETVANICRAIYSISLLTANSPEVLVEELMQVAPLPLLPDLVSLGLRSDLLRRRPDVRQAEREIAARTADIGVAVAAFYPTFSLLGDAGLQSISIHNFFQSASRTWAYGADLNGPIYQGGKLTGNLHAAEAAKTMAFHAYRETVLAALQDTESALVAYAEDLKAARNQKESVEKYEKIVEIVSSQLRSGLIDQTVFFNHQRQLIAAQQLQLESDIAARIDLVALYKALGGGWQPDYGGT